MKSFVKAGIFFIFLFSAFYLDNISFAQNAEEELLYFPPIAIYSINETQAPSLTAWDNRLIPVATLLAYQESEVSNAGYKGPEEPYLASFDLDTGFAQGLSGILPAFPNLYSFASIVDTVAFQKLLSEPYEPTPPVSLEIINKEEKVFKLTLGDKDISSISFVVKPDGIYDLGGIFKGATAEFEWKKERFSISAYGEQDILKISLKPFASNLTPQLIYTKDFSLGVFEGKAKFSLINNKPCVEIELGDKKEGESSISIDPDEVLLDFSSEIPAGTSGITSIEADSFSIAGGKIKGNLVLSFDEDGQSVVLSLGANSYFEVSRDGTVREIIDAFFSELAEEMCKIIKESPDEFDGMDSDTTVEDIKKILWDATGDNLDGLAKSIEEINEQRQGLVVPAYFRFLMNFSEQENKRHCELILPLIAKALALKADFGLDVQEVSFISSLDEARGDQTIEVGYTNDQGNDSLFLKVTELSSVSMAQLSISPANGIESIGWIAGGLRGEINLSGFEIGSIEDSMLGLSAFDVLFGRFNSENEGISWQLRYNFPRSADLDLDIPFNALGLKDSYLLLGVGTSGLDFGLKFPFVAGGMLKVTNKGFEYKLNRNNIVLAFSGGGGVWEIKFGAPSATK